MGVRHVWSWSEPMLGRRREASGIGSVGWRSKWAKMASTTGERMPSAPVEGERRWEKVWGGVRRLVRGCPLHLYTKRGEERHMMFHTCTNKGRGEAYDVSHLHKEGRGEERHA